MDKNILVIGVARSGKTTLAKRLAQEECYNVVSIDNLISALEMFPELNIRHCGEFLSTTQRLAPFLIKHLQDLAQGPLYAAGIRFVIEGTHIDFASIIPLLHNSKYASRYEIIGLTYNYLTEEQLFDYIKTYDTEEDWTYWCDDQHLHSLTRLFVERNKFFAKKFNEYNIKTFDVSFNRDQVIESIMQYLKEPAKNCYKPMIKG